MNGAQASLERHIDRGLECDQENVGTHRADQEREPGAEDDRHLHDHDADIEPEQHHFGRAQQRGALVRRASRKAEIAPQRRRHGLEHHQQAAPDEEREAAAPTIRSPR